jgi:hypothetical protein
MIKWLYDRPWIWIVVLLTLLVGGGLFVVGLAEMNKPTIVKEKRPKTVIVLPVVHDARLTVPV